MASRQRDSKSVFLPYKCTAVHSLCLHPVVRFLYKSAFRVFLTGFLLQNPADFRHVFRHNDRHLLFDDACLLPGDLRQRIPQKRLVVIAYGGDHRQHRVFYNVGGVAGSSHARLNESEIHPLLRKIKEGQGCLHLKKSRQAQRLPPGNRRLPRLLSWHLMILLCLRVLHLRHGALHAGEIHFQFIRRNFFPVNLKSFLIGMDGRRNVPAHPVSSLFQHRCQKCKDRAFSIGSRDMHDAQPLFRMSQDIKKPSDCLKSGGASSFF